MYSPGTPRSSLFSLQNNDQAHYPQHNRLQPGVLGEHNRDIAHERHECHHTPDYVLSL